ncbi:MAG TPA: type I-U CRISPR-associated helicase/endonuclease Cas3, partial [Lacipirellulaceae bacterium]|nr:type I-U CRISPR-associated helicase/endonuclease Cas3 [Lacipirellulaceae bacterium]
MPAAADFGHAFCQLTGNPPFPWQRALYEHFNSGDIPASCNLPTGLGKTSVIAVWLIALANRATVPRRLVYVVNRRTVVDQTTEEVEQYKRQQVADIPDFAVSTLRGQFADNREWSADPSRPAVICGTVDMIGSRLLFSGYGVGMKAKPLHAGFLGQDALLVHDEAHLEPAFQTLIEKIRDEQIRCNDFRPLRVMELTATRRGIATPFGLTDEDWQHSVVQKRVTAHKALYLEPIQDANKLAEQLVAKATQFVPKNRSVLVFARTVDHVLKVASKLPRDRVVTLTGTMRGKERDALVEHPIFRRFLPGGESDEPSVFLVCTSAGEVGVNISADHAICDLSTFDSMTQRFGRVNRFGTRRDSQIHIIHPSDFKNDDYDQRRQRTLQLLRALNRDGSPQSLNQLDPQARQAAYAPIPPILPATDILLDAWALTTIKGKLPGRPPVEP